MTFKERLERDLQDPEFRKLWDDDEEEYRLISKEIRRRHDAEALKEAGPAYLEEMRDD